jgi:beta-glucanase (GH16 family)
MNLAHRFFIFLFMPLRWLLAEPPAGANWTPIPQFTDEFDLKELDLKKWQIGNPEKWLGREPGMFMDHNVTVQNGMLRLQMKAEELVNAPAGYKEFSCASVCSRNRIRYGYFEAKMKIMNSKGSSAFWFYHHAKDLWTELDVFEMCAGGSPEGGKLHTNAVIHYGPGVPNQIADTASFLMPDDPSQNFHVYGFEWDIQFLYWYLDGKLVRKKPNVHWQQTLYLLFDTEIMDPWFGRPEKSTLPSTFEIDYVRAWQKKG